MKSFIELERKCEATFQNAGPFWHAYTSGKTTPLLFAGNEDFVFVINVVARAKLEFPEVLILAFEVMNNHFHFVICSEKERIEMFWNCIRKRLKKYYPDIECANLSIKGIENISSLRNNIAYTHRNGYVANPDYTPFSYPWGTGRYYFLDAPVSYPISKLRVEDVRTMFRSRTIEIPEEWRITSCGVSPSESARNLCYISPAYFCVINFGMAMFRNAHHYFSMVSKSVEAYSGIAAEVDDDEFLTDTELYSHIGRILRNQYQGLSLRNISKAQRLDLARTLRFEFRSSNDQIRRLLGLTKYEVDALFPLSAEK